MPSENGGGGTSTRRSAVATGSWRTAAVPRQGSGQDCDPPAAAGACPPPIAAVVRNKAPAAANPKSTAILRMGVVHRPLHLAQPHRLEHLQAPADDGGDVERERIADR